MKLEPNLLCMMVGHPTNNYRLVRTLYRCHCGEWECEALQTLDGYTNLYIMGLYLGSKPYQFKPGDVLQIAPENLKPLPGDDVVETTEKVVTNASYPAW